MATVRLNLDLSFEVDSRTQVENALRDYVLPLAQNAVSINEGQENEEIGSVIVLICHHDEVPTQPCTVEAKWEIRQGQIVRVI